MPCLCMQFWGYVLHSCAPGHVVVKGMELGKKGQLMPEMLAVGFCSGEANRILFSQSCWSGILSRLNWRRTFFLQLWVPNHTPTDWTVEKPPHASICLLYSWQLASSLRMVAIQCNGTSVVDWQPSGFIWTEKSKEWCQPCPFLLVNYWIPPPPRSPALHSIEENGFVVQDENWEDSLIT